MTLLGFRLVPLSMEPFADLPLRDPVTKEDIQDHFKTHGAGTITEVKLMNGFGFIEYDDAMDARDVVPGMLQHLCGCKEILTNKQ